MAIGTISILFFYSLLNEHYRFSRALILLGALWGTGVITGLRFLLHLFEVNGFRLNAEKNKRFIIVGEKEEVERVSELLQRTGMTPAFIGMVSYHQHRNNTNGFIGHLGQIKEIITIYKIDEVIFCAKDVPAQVIIDKMSNLNNEQVDYKIAPPESLSIIGSNSINTSGDLYVIDINTIIKKSNRRNKRLLDLIVAATLLLLYPFLLFIVKRPLGLLKNIAFVFLAFRSWVGYIAHPEPESQRLPAIKPGVLNPQDAFREKTIDDETILRLNLLYARDYNLANDINIILKGLRNLGRN